MTQPLHSPQPRFDLLRVPLIGRLLRWRWGRLVGQLLLLLAALLLIYDGFTGPKLAPENLATVIVWVHYRGFLVFALLFFGNLFCMNCPFTLPRTLARKLSIRGWRWPRKLRNKWTAVIILVLYFWLYEWLDLWSSPAITAWLIIGYFVTAFVLEAFFTESPFCKYVCPLGTFNFISSTISPLQISVNSRDTCRTCVGKECINGSAQTLGCGTQLFAPQIQSNMDCILCLDCARACPYDNVALIARSPFQETSRLNAWPRRWDLSFLVLIFAFTGVSNAFGMVPPVYELELWLSTTLGIDNEGIILLLIFSVLNLVLPIGLGLGAAWLSRTLARPKESLRVTLARYAPSFVPLAFAGWLAHYGGFHFLSSALAIIPVFQNFLLDHNVAILGQPDWTRGPVFPMNWLDPIELILVLIGFGASLYVLTLRARQSKDGLAVQLPWIILLLGLAIAMLLIFYLPMEMRGSAFFS
jgi:ferredoxin